MMRKVMRLLRKDEFNLFLDYENKESWAKKVLCCSYYIPTKPLFR